MPREKVEHYTDRFNILNVSSQNYFNRKYRCSNLVGKSFQVIFWHDNLTEQNCKDFVKRNEHLLFEVNTKITKRFENTWFLINSRNEKSSGRYRYEGDILSGISEYIKIINHMKNRDSK